MSLAAIQNNNPIAVGSSDPSTFANNTSIQSLVPDLGRKLLQAVLANATHNSTDPCFNKGGTFNAPSKMWGDATSAATVGAAACGLGIVLFSVGHLFPRNSAAASGLKTVGGWMTVLGGATAFTAGSVLGTLQHYDGWCLGDIKKLKAQA